MDKEENNTTVDNEVNEVANEETNNEVVDEGQEVEMSENGEQLPQETKPKKKHTLLKILIPIGAILVIAAVLAVLFGKQTLQYFDAKDKMAAHDYQAAYETFESLGSFFGSAEKAKESKYHYAVNLFAKEEYGEAKRLFSSLGDYQDASDYVSKCNAEKDEISLILKMIFDGQYSQAQTKINSLPNNNKDKNFLSSVVQYLLADKELKAANYKEAITLFTKVSSFSDAKTKLSEAKYRYVNQSSSKTDEWTVYNYLRDLINDNYPGAQTKYDQLYTKKADMYFNGSSDGTDRQTSLSRWKPVYCHIKLSGFKPDEEVQLCYSTYFSDGDKFENSKFNSKSRNGSWHYVYWKDGPQGSCSWVTIVVFIEGGPELGRATVNLY